ncbi:MAG TPA: PilW family protein [Burkholderiaceae bacterium]|nr:PilW family protein [Burkholderiaceae bacterium]
MTCIARCRRERGGTAGGFSLIELMVVLVIGTVLAIVITKLMAVFEGSKRTSTTVNDMDNSGTASIQQLDFAIRSAGGGFAQTNAQSYGCALFASRKIGGTPTTVLPATALPVPFGNVLGVSGINGPIRLAPVVILAGNTPGTELASAANGSSDVLLVMGGAASGTTPAGGGTGPGTGGATGVPTPMTGAPTATTLALQTTAGFAPGDVVLLTDDDTSTGRANCMLEEVAPTFAPTVTTTALPLGGSFYSASISGGSLGTASVSNLSVDALPVPIGNMAADIPVANASNNVPQFRLYGVGNSAAPVLYTYDLLAGTTATNTPQPIADSVLEIHALYGLDTDGNNIIDTWQSPTGAYAASALLAGTDAAAAKLLQIKAIRLGVILRSDLMEKAQCTSGAGTAPVTCDATHTTYAPVTAGPVQLFANVPCPLDTSTATAGCGGATGGTTAAFLYSRALTAGTVANPSEQGYRYRTVEVTIPIRNDLLICTSNC